MPQHSTEHDLRISDHCVLLLLLYTQMIKTTTQAMQFTITRLKRETLFAKLRKD